jgi:hypothetical protein
MRNTARTVVLAKNLQMFHAWCRQTGHSPRDPSVVYAVGPQSLRGLHGEVEIVQFADWWDRLDRRALQDAAAILAARCTGTLEAA